MVYHLGLVLISFAGLAAGLLVTRRRVLWLPAVALLYVTLLNAVLVSESRHNLTLIPTLACAGIGGLVLAARRLRAPRGLEAVAQPALDPPGTAGRRPMRAASGTAG
jgi:hypothetical protein